MNTPAEPPPSSAAEGTPPSGPAQASVFGLMVFIWGTTWFAIKVGLDAYPPFFTLALRFGIAGPILLLLTRLRGERIPWAPRHQPFFLSLALLSFVTSFGVVYWGEQYLSSGLTSVIFATMPLFTGVAAHFILKAERLGLARVAGLVLGLGGIVVINASDLGRQSPMAPVAAPVVLVAPLVSAAATVLSKKRSRDFPPLTLAAIPMIYAAVIHAGLWALLERGRPLAWSWPGVGSIAYLTLFGSVVTFSGYFWLLRHVEVSRLNLLAYLTPLVALALGYVAAGEVLTPRMAAGAALVLVGVAVANRPHRRPA